MHCKKKNTIFLFFLFYVGKLAREKILKQWKNNWQQNKNKAKYYIRICKGSYSLSWDYQVACPSHDTYARACARAHARPTTAPISSTMTPNLFPVFCSN